MAGERILVVDDNAANLKLASFVLRSHGFEVKLATGAAAAMEEIATQRPRLVLMDVQMPGVDGLTLTKRLKEDPATKDIVIIAFTAYAMRGDAEKALAAGCDGYLPKPIDTLTFADQVAAYLT